MIQDLNDVLLYNKPLPSYDEEDDDETIMENVKDIMNNEDEKGPASNNKDKPKE